MLNKKKKCIVCMAIDDESGFTLLEQLFVITVISITLPLLAILIGKLQHVQISPDIKVQQFFQFIRDDAFQAKYVYTDNNRIYFQLNEIETAKIEKYGSVIRRQVNGQGHEIYLRDVRELQLQPTDGGVTMYIETEKGERYEKEIHFYAVQ